MSVGVVVERKEMFGWSECMDVMIVDVGVGVVGRQECGKAECDVRDVEAYLEAVVSLLIQMKYGRAGGGVQENIEEATAGDENRKIKRQHRV